MHLLLAQKGTISDGNEAVDLGQTPGEIVFLSAADTELASIAQAHRLAPDMPSLRLANFLGLTHPMSVDAYVERTARHAKLIVVRIIGGETYWPYGLEALHACAITHGAKMAVLPGDDKPDHGLDRFSTIPAGERDDLWHYLIESGAANTHGFLAYCKALISGCEKPEAAAPLLKAGLWWPGEAVSSLTSVQRHWADPAAPVAAIIFYRALVQSGQTQPVDALIAALQARGSIRFQYSFRASRIHCLRRWWTACLRIARRISCSTLPVLRFPRRERSASPRCWTSAAIWFCR
ncbi:hypothetical protein ACJ70_05155 [Brucella abortus]|nr:hypothetical protein ACJ70_05155 [Brucella abortus]